MTKASRWWSPNTWSGCGSKCKTPFAVVSISGNATDDRGWKGVKVSRWWSATPDLDTRQCRSSCKEQCRAVWNIQHSSVGFAIRFTGNVMQYSALSLNLVQYVQCPFFENACEGLMGVKGYLSAMWMEPCTAAEALHSLAQQQPCAPQVRWRWEPCASTAFPQMPGWKNTRGLKSHMKNFQSILWWFNIIFDYFQASKMIQPLIFWMRCEEAIVCIALRSEDVH